MKPYEVEGIPMSQDELNQFEERLPFDCDWQRIRIVDPDFEQQHGYGSWLFARRTATGEIRHESTTGEDGRFLATGLKLE